MNFPQAISAVFSDYADFTGRSLRSEYWYWVLFITIAEFGLKIIEAVIFGTAYSNAAIDHPLTVLFKLATLIPGIAVSVRRLHDVNRSGWWLLIAFTIIGIVPLIYWHCKKGTVGPNRFGTDQLAGMRSLNG